MGRLVDHKIESTIGELVHVSRIHDQPLHTWSLERVASLHDIDDHLRDVVIDDVVVPIVVHMFAERRVATAHNEYFDVFVRQEMLEIWIEVLVAE